MDKEEKNQKMSNHIGTIMLCYAIIAIVMLLMRKWTTMDIILFIANIINFILFQFLNINKITISLLCIIIGGISLFCLQGIIIIIGAIMAIYGLILLIKLGG